MTSTDVPEERPRRDDGRPLADFELKIYARAGLSPSEAVAWANGGIEPYQAERYRAVGLTLDEAMRWRRGGVMGAEAESGNLESLRQRVESTLERLSPLESRCTERLQSLRPSERSAVAKVVAKGVDVDTMANWINADGPIDDVEAWLQSGVTPRVARRFGMQGIKPPDRAKLEQYEAAGFSVEEAIPWIARSIKVRQAAAFSRRGFTEAEAAEFIDAGISAKKAQQLRLAANKPARTVIELPPIDPDLAWTSEELKSLDVATLRFVLAQDLRVEPQATSGAALRKEILREQEKKTYRGTICWIDAGEDVVLYDPAQARVARRFLAALATVGTWGDLRRLVRRKPGVAESALAHVWEIWDGGWGRETLGIGHLSEDDCQDIGGIDDLVAAVPPETPLEFENVTGDGDFVFVDPFDPMQMGVPLLIVRRYCVERFGAVSSWTATPGDDLLFVRRTLKALGWGLRRGKPDDVMWG